MGVFSSIKRAWMTIDHILFLWDYTDPRGSFYQYDGLDQVRPAISYLEALNTSPVSQTFFPRGLFSDDSKATMAHRQSSTPLWFAHVMACLRRMQCPRGSFCSPHRWRWWCLRSTAPVVRLAALIP